MTRKYYSPFTDKRLRNVVHESYHNNIHVLIKHFPEIFNKEMPKPLNLGVFEDIKHFNLMDEKSLADTLFIWTSRWEYKVALAVYKYRFNLFGSKRSTVSPEERTHAIEYMKTYSEHLQGMVDVQVKLIHSKELYSFVH